MFRILAIIFIFNLVEAFTLGLENLAEIKKYNFGKIGLVTNQTGITQDLERNLDYLLYLGYEISYIYVPEHGFTGTTKAGEQVDNSRDAKTNIEIISLYIGDKNGEYYFNQNFISDIDTFVFDMQDSGMRHYTYISIMYKMLEVAAKYNKNFVVLDRPNPLGPIMEGPLVEENYISFVGIAAIPVRHGLTVGELALYFNKYCLKNPAKLTVIPMLDYKRDQNFGEIKVPLSPNIGHIDSCHGYSFLCLLNSMFKSDIGLDTKYAFQRILIPDQSIEFWQDLQVIFSEYNIESNLITEDNKVLGVSIKILDINNFSSINLLLDLIKLFTKYKIEQEYTTIAPRLIGTSYFIQKINSNYIEKINKELTEFNQQVQECLLYSPKPKITYLKG